MGLKGIAVGKERFLADGFSYSLLFSYNLLKNLNFYAIIHIGGDDMFKYRFACSNKDNILFAINQIIANDSPCGKSIFGGDLYKSGIHFEICEEKIKGFFLAESENESHRGAPIRVCFSGEFAEEENDLFFDVYIYPRIVEILLLIFAFIFLSFFGKATGVIISVVVLCIFVVICIFTIIIRSFIFLATYFCFFRDLDFSIPLFFINIMLYLAISIVTSLFALLQAK